MNDQQAIIAEREAAETYRLRIREAVREGGEFMARWGDGNAGYMIEVFLEELKDAGLYRLESGTSGMPGKEKISRTLSKAVFERDGYRCVMCNSHIDLCCDHIISERDGGPTTLENLQTMCNTCNCKKGSKSFSVLKGAA